MIEIYISFVVTEQCYQSRRISAETVSGLEHDEILPVNPHVSWFHWEIFKKCFVLQMFGATVANSGSGRHSAFVENTENMTVNIRRSWWITALGFKIRVSCAGFNIRTCFLCYIFYVTQKLTKCVNSVLVSVWLMLTYWCNRCLLASTVADMPQVCTNLHI